MLVKDVDDLGTQYFVLSTQYRVRSTKHSRRYSSTWRQALSSVFWSLSLFLTLTQPLLAAPPKVNFFFPAGGQRGQTVEVSASGEFSSWPVQVWADRPGITATCEADKGKLKIAIDPAEGAGTYWLRLFDGEGASALRPFVVGTLPEVAEAETNDSPDKAQRVEAGVVVNGKLAKTGDVDGFAVSLKQGEQLVAVAQANSQLGSPMDSVLQVGELVERRSSSIQQTNSVEAFVAAQSHDGVGLDPHVVFTAPRDGNYLVRLFAFPSEPNSTIGFTGGDNFVYRLTITKSGLLDHVLPLTLPMTAIQVKPVGWNVPADAMIDVAAFDPAANLLTPPDEPLEWLFHPTSAGAIALPRSAEASIIAADDSDPSKSQEVTLPCVISGRIEPAGDADAFSFQGTKGQKVQAEVESAELGFPLDGLLLLLDAAGKTVAESDDTGRGDRDPSLTATLSEDGVYRLVLRDLHSRGGLRFAYRLSIETPQPDFSLSPAGDSFVLSGAGPLEIPLTATGQEGFKGPVEIQVIGLPAGVTAEPLSVEPAAASGDSGSGRRRGRRGGGSNPPAANAKLILKADTAVAQAGGMPIRIEGRFKNDQGELVRTARFSLGLPMAGSHHAAWLTVKK